MRIKTRKLLILVFLLSITTAAQVQIGSGTETDESLPIEPNYGYSYSQAIYLKSEIGSAGGTITELKYYYNGDGISYSNDWTIYIGHTSKSSFSGDNDWVSTSQLTQVYSGTFSDPGSSGWITFDINDFTYNGTDNLVIAVDENQDDYDDSDDQFYCTATTGSDRSLVFYDDSDNPDPDSPPDGSTRQFIPNIILVGLNFDQPTVTTQAVSNISTNSATGNGNITDIGLSSVTAYGVCWNTTGSPTIADNHTDEGSSLVTGSFTSLITNLMSATNYYVRAYATNSVGTSYGDEVFFATILGSGTESDPYQISTLEDLRWVSENKSTWSSYFIQTSDINAGDTKNWNKIYNPFTNDIENYGFKRIGNSVDWFRGNYNGQGHSIDSLHLFSLNGSYSGLFSKTYGATIKNLGVTNVNIKVGGSSIGALIGKAEQGTIIENCYSTGKIEMDSDPTDQSSVGGWGGLIGECHKYVEVNNCYSSVDIDGAVTVAVYQEDDSGNYVFDHYNKRGVVSVGGFVGSNYNSTIQKCFSTGNLIGLEEVGGFVGHNEYGSTIKNCYSLGKAVKDSNSQATPPASAFGGFCGYNEDSEIINCYSTGGVEYEYATNPSDKGFTGNASSDGSIDYKMLANFWDMGTSNQTGTAGSTANSSELPVGKTTVEMKTQTTFTDAGWDFTSVWAIDPSKNDGYPYLLWESSTTAVDEIKTTPSQYTLYQNYPNPFNPTTTIKYEVPKEGFVSLKIYDILGREVKTLVSKKQTAGKYRVQFNASDLASGIYFYRLHSDSFNKIKKMILLK